VNVTLPPASAAIGRFVTIQRADRGRRVIVRPQTGEMIDGARSPIVMDTLYDAITFITDGHEWVVFSRRR
jgi:hypothetical protein